MWFSSFRLSFSECYNFHWLLLSSGVEKVQICHIKTKHVDHFYKSFKKKQKSISIALALNFFCLLISNVFSISKWNTLKRTLEQLCTNITAQKTIRNQKIQTLNVKNKKYEQDASKSLFICNHDFDTTKKSLKMHFVFPGLGQNPFGKNILRNFRLYQYFRKGKVS